MAARALVVAATVAAVSAGAAVGCRQGPPQASWLALTLAYSDSSRGFARAGQGIVKP